MCTSEARALDRLEQHQVHQLDHRGAAGDVQQVLARGEILQVIDDLLAVELLDHLLGPPGLLLVRHVDGRHDCLGVCQGNLGRPPQHSRGGVRLLPLCDIAHCQDHCLTLAAKAHDLVLTGEIDGNPGNEVRRGRQFGQIAEIAHAQRLGRRTQDRGFRRLRPIARPQPVPQVPRAAPRW